MDKIYTTGRRVRGRVLCEGRMLRYDATAISAKSHRLRGHRENLAAKRNQYATLLAGIDAADTRRAHLQALHTRADREHNHVCARIRHLNKSLAPTWRPDRLTGPGITILDGAVPSECLLIDAHLS